MLDRDVLQVGGSVEDPEAFNALVADVGVPSLLIVAEERLGPKLRLVHAPVDVVQETILAAWRDRAGYRHRSDGEARAWLLTIMDNRIRDLARHETRLKRGGDRVPLSLEVVPEGGTGRAGAWGERAPIDSTTPSQMARHVELAERISTALGTLDAVDRSLLIIAIMEGRGTREAARQLDIPESSARSRVRRALGRIGPLLPELGPVGPVGPQDGA